MSVDDSYLTTYPKPSKTEGDDKYGTCPKSVKEKYGGKCPGYDDCPKEVKEKYGGKCPAAKEIKKYQQKLEDENMKVNEELKKSKETIDQLTEKVTQLESELSTRTTEIKEKDSQIEESKSEISKLNEKLVEVEAQLLAQKEETSQLESFAKEILLHQIEAKDAELSGLDEKTSSELYEIVQEIEKKEITERITKMAPSADLSKLSELDTDSLKKFEEILSKSLANLPETQPKKSAPSDESSLSARVEYSTEGVIKYLRSIKK